MNSQREGARTDCRLPLADGSLCPKPIGHPDGCSELRRESPSLDVIPWSLSQLGERILGIRLADCRGTHQACVVNIQAFVDLYFELRSLRDVADAVRKKHMADEALWAATALVRSASSGTVEK